MCIVVGAGLVNPGPLAISRNVRHVFFQTQVAEFQGLVIRCGDPLIETPLYDVVVAHPFTTGVPQGSCGELKCAEPSAEAALGPAEKRKISEYQPPVDANGTRLAAAVNIVPLAFDTYGRWGKGVADELKRWARRRLLRPDAMQSVRSKGVYAELLSRWRASAACILQRGNFEVYADCVGLVASDETSPGEMMC